MDDVWTDAAAWVQAVGTIAAVIGAAWVAASESRAGRRREEAIRLEAIEREQRSLRASQAAAVNLAILAATQVHRLHSLLRDETRRNQVARVSPSRTLVATERQLIAFPIQSLCDANAMVAFSYFPGALETAAEIYAHLELEVRAVDEAGRGAIFVEYAKQMAHLDNAVQRRLAALKAAVGSPPELSGPPQGSGVATTARSAAFSED